MAKGRCQLPISRYGFRRIGPERAEPDETEDGALSAGALRRIMEEQYSELIEAPAETVAADGVFPILMKYTTVSYKLPSKVEAGQWVTFEITGPDMEKIIARLDETMGRRRFSAGWSQSWQRAAMR